MPPKNQNACASSKARAKASPRSQTRSQSPARSQSPGNRTAANHSAEPTGCESDEVHSATVKAIFKKFDSNGDGVISKDELKRVLVHLDPSSEQNIDILFEVMDQNKNDAVDYEAFVDFLLCGSTNYGKTRAHFVKSVLPEKVQDVFSEDDVLAFGFSLGLLNGWATQPSNCCAGASMAACINALNGVPMGNIGALTFSNGCDVLAAVMKDHADEIAARLQNQLGYEPSPCLQAVEISLDAEHVALRDADKKQLREAIHSVAAAGGSGALGAARKLLEEHEQNSSCVESVLATVPGASGIPTRNLVPMAAVDEAAIGNHTVNNAHGADAPAESKAFATAVGNAVDELPAGVPVVQQDPRNRVDCPRCGQNDWDGGERQRRVPDALCDLCGQQRAERCNSCNLDACRKCLFPGQVNDEGALVSPGHGACGKIFYCGRLVGVTLPGSDGKCGPRNGPQCPACLRFQQQPHIQELLQKCAGTHLVGWGALVVWSTVEADWMEWLQKLRSVEELRHPSKPKTWSVGNPHILEALTKLGSFEGCRFLGRKENEAPVQIPVSKKDSEEEILQQWEAIKSIFSAASEEVLLFHLTNHYCPIYAWRERSDPDGSGGILRELLVNRSGQRPKEWMDWIECRAIMSKWIGYKILKIRRVDSSDSRGGELVV